MEARDLKIGYLVFATEEYYGEYLESLGGYLSRGCEKKVFMLEEIEDLYLSPSIEPIPITKEFIEKIEWDTLGDDLSVLCKVYNGYVYTGYSRSKKINYIHELQEALDVDESTAKEWLAILKSIYEKSNN